MKTHPVYLALDALHTRHLNLYKNTNQHNLPVATFDSAWPSACASIIEPPNHYWKHHDKSDYSLFDDIEKALELSFIEDIKVFYGAFWANGFCVERNDINFNLIQIWNEEDQEQLKENMLGHCFAKLKSKLPLTFFIGSTFGDDIISIDNHSGEIVLEKPGRRPHKVLSTNMEAFLISLTPTTDIY